MYYIHKHEVSLASGGPEEGGWWYEIGVPTKDQPIHIPFATEDEAYEACRELNSLEEIRAKKEEKYDYYSVLAYESRHYAYSVSDEPVAKPYPETRPHYE